MILRLNQTIERYIAIPFFWTDTIKPCPPSLNFDNEKTYNPYYRSSKHDKSEISHDLDMVFKDDRPPQNSFHEAPAEMISTYPIALQQDNPSLSSSSSFTSPSETDPWTDSDGHLTQSILDFIPALDGGESPLFSATDEGSLFSAADEDPLFPATDEDPLLSAADEEPSFWGGGWDSNLASLSLTSFLGRGGGKAGNYFWI